MAYSGRWPISALDPPQEAGLLLPFKHKDVPLSSAHVLHNHA